jgi:hypothetical protein
VKLGLSYGNIIITVGRTVCKVQPITRTCTDQTMDWDLCAGHIQWILGKTNHWKALTRKVS